MLALFDSYDNALKGIGSDMNRTHLYDELLRRFCRREGLKLGKQSSEAQRRLEEQYVQSEMVRLGVVAMGMFNRKKLHIHTKDLFSDLQTFRVIDEKEGSSGEADSLIRSFFFVNKSEANVENKFKKEYAYEFLHNTFGEFLTADFILSYLVRETIELTFAKNNKFQANIVQKKLYEPNGLGYEWYLSLMFSPLYSRPLVLEMIREHLPCVLERFEFSQEDFQKSLIEIVECQLKVFLEEKNLPSTIHKPDGFKDVKIPLVGHISTYTLNITILASLLSTNGFIFDERNYLNEMSKDSHDFEIRPWDKLAHLWKTWFSSDNLTGLARVINSSRNENIVTIKCRDQFDSETEMNKIERQLSVADALSDEMMTALCGLQTAKFAEITKMTNSEILSFLQKTDKNLYSKHIVNILRREISGLANRMEFSDINHLISLLIEKNIFEELSVDVVIEIFLVIEVALANYMVYLENQEQLFMLIAKTDRRILWDKDEHISFLAHRLIVLMSRNIGGIISEKELYRFGKKSVQFIDDYDLSGSLLSFRERELFFNFDERRYINSDNEDLYGIINENNIMEYMKTAPEMVSRYILFVSQHRIGSPKIVEQFLHLAHRYFDDFRRPNRYYHSDEFHSRKYQSYSELRILFNSITAAENINEISYIQYAHRAITDILRNTHPEFVMHGLFLHPSLVGMVYEHMPELLYDILRHVEKDIEIFVERNSRERSIFVGLGFIALFRKIEHIDDSIGLKIVHIIDKSIMYYFKYASMENVKIKDMLSANEYENLVWYIQSNDSMYRDKFIRKTLGIDL